MIESLFNKLTRVYQISFVFLIAVALATVFYFWQSGFIDGSRIQKVHKASFMLETYSQKKALAEIQEHVHAENPKKAIESINKINKELESVNDIVRVEHFDDVLENAEKLRGEASKLIKFNKSEKVVLVFSGKLSRFNQYVKSNKWRTLTRMSERVYSQVSGHLNKAKLASLSKNVLRDFESMKKITENSVLSRADKAEIINRLNNLKTEMIMLGKFASARDKFDSRFDRYQGAVQQWLQKVSPEITMGKIENQQIGKTYVYAMLSFAFLLAIMLAMSFGFNFWYLKAANKSMEQNIENYLSDGILGCDDTVYANASESFIQYSKKMSGYIAKRMSFGKVFGESLPFASVLLDENLKVKWANNQFCDDWQVSTDEIKKEYMSWDYLNKLTNIGSDDPIMEALKNNIAGIYQIQMKANEQEQAKAYEMFVSPVKDENGTKIMLYFYDLTNLQDTIHDQSKSILNPVKKSIDHILSGDFVASEQMEYEFKIADISEVYEKFISLNENIYYSENEYLAKLRTQEYEFSRLCDLISGIEIQNEESSQELAKIKVALQTFKTNVLGLSGDSKDLLQTLMRSQELVSTNIAALKASASKVNSMKSLTEELTSSLPRFDEVRGTMKQNKKALQENKIKLASQITKIKKEIGAQENSGLALLCGQLEQAFEALMHSNEDMEKNVSSVEIGLSKAQMILTSGQDKLVQINDQYEVSQINYSTGEYQRIEKQLGQFDLDLLENEIVASLSDLFYAYKNLVNQSGELKKKIHNIDPHIYTSADQTSGQFQYEGQPENGLS